MKIGENMEVSMLENSVIGNGDPVVLIVKKIVEKDDGSTTLDEQTISLGTGFSGYEGLLDELDSVLKYGSSQNIPSEAYESIKNADEINIMTISGIGWKKNDGGNKLC